MVIRIERKIVAAAETAGLIGRIVQTIMVQN
jgi:hypothetical protein